MAAIRFKSFHEEVNEALEDVKGQTTIKVVTKDGREQQVENVFVDTESGEFVMVTKGVLDPETIDVDDADVLTAWRAEHAEQFAPVPRASRKTAAPAKRGKGTPTPAKRSDNKAKANATSSTPKRRAAAESTNSSPKRARRRPADIPVKSKRKVRRG